MNITLQDRFDFKNALIDELIIEFKYSLQEIEICNRNSGAIPCLALGALITPPPPYF